MSQWIRIESHDWRDQRHNLSYYGVTDYLNLDTGERRFEYKGRLYVYNSAKQEYEAYTAPKLMKDGE